MGSWQVLPYQAPILPVHAALLRTGKVLFVAGSGNDPNNTSDQALAQGSAVLDLKAGTFTRPSIPLNAAGHPYDLFCCGHSFRNDGKLLVAGGTLKYDPFFGLTTALLFDPATQAWSVLPSMHNGRWYPTVLTLGSGRILALGGDDSNGGQNVQPEIYSPSYSGGWNAFPPTSTMPDYAQLILLADGRIFFSGGCMGGSGSSPRTLTLPSSFSTPITEVQVPGLPAADSPDQATTVLLPPAQNQQVMIMGGGNASGMATTRVAIANFTTPNPTYTAAPSLLNARMHLSAVLLPDRTVFVCNGSHMAENTSTSSLPAEIYDPAAGVWTAVEPQSTPRVYHSVALLLPDGRVLTAGGNPARGTNELHLEVYSPSYMSRSRPVIQRSPSSLKYGGSVSIQTPQAASIKWVSLIKPSANTHSVDTEQRLVDLPITSRTTTSLTVSITSNRNTAPAGYYMLFLSDTAGTPSTAAWTRLG